MKTSSITIRPLNPDNELEVHQLVALFERCPQGAALSEAVLSPRFWQGAAGRRFTSLLAYYEGKLVAHCGFGTLARFSRERGARASKAANLSHLLITPAAAELVSAIAFRFNEVIEGQLCRKGINSLLAVHSSGSDLSATLLKAMGLTQVAAFEDSSRFLQIYARSMDSAPRTVEFLPAQLREVVTATFKTLQISTSDTDASELSDAVPADDLSVQPLPFSKAHRVLLLLTPSLLQRNEGGTLSKASIERLLEGRSATLVGIKISDRGCTDLSRIVQSLGFEYCGMLPALFGRDSILFAKRNTSARSVHSQSWSAAQGM
ncbi:MAG: hypothetical protein EBZ48_11480 [Proteobacteria bacterium]|nr:hypothetical protein [Pseudomonadota bacterium]